MNQEKASVIVKLWKTQKSLFIVGAGVFGYFILFSVVSILRYNAFSFNDFDLAVFVHTYWKILHGSGQLSILKDIPIWGNTLELICYVTSPIFLFSGMDPRSLLIGQAFILAAGALPVYLIARHRLPEPMAVCMALSYLFHPAIWYCNLYEYYPIVYATFTLLMAFYFLEQNRFGWFMVFILLSLINRADIGIITMMYGVYAFALRRSWKWVLWPMMLSVGWVFAGLFLIIPKFNHNIFHASYYSHFGHGFGEIIKNMILHPELVWKHFVTPLNGKYFLEMLYPVGFLSLAGMREFLICIFSLLQHLASNRSSEHTIYYHYTATITPFVYISAIHGMARLTGKRKVTIALWSLPLVLSVLANISYGPLAHYKEYVVQLKKDDEDNYKRTLIKRIPQNVPVTSTFEFSPMLAGRERFYSFHYIYNGLFLDKQPFITPVDIQYALINFDDPRMLSFQRENSDQNIRTFIQEGPFGVVDQINNVVLFKKGHEGTFRLYDAFPIALPQVSLWDVQGILKLLKMDHQLIQKQGYPVIRMSYQWAVTQPVEADIQMWIGVFDDQGREVYRLTRPICYGALPTYRWKPEYAYGDYVDVLLPSHLRRGHYKLFVAVFASGSRQFLPIVKRDHQGNAVSSKPTVNVYNFQIP